MQISFRNFESNCQFEHVLSFYYLIQYAIILVLKVPLLNARAIYYALELGSNAI